MSIADVINQQVITKLNHMERFQNIPIFLSGTYFLPYIELSTFALILKLSLNDIIFLLSQRSPKLKNMSQTLNYILVDDAFSLLKICPHPDFEFFLTKKIIPLLARQQIKDRKALSNFINNSLLSYKTLPSNYTFYLEPVIEKVKRSVLPTKHPEAYATYLILYLKDEEYFFFAGYMSSFNAILKKYDISKIFEYKLKNAQMCLKEIRNQTIRAISFKINGNRLYLLKPSALKDIQRVSQLISLKYR